MPFTFAHPAVVLPLLKKKYFSATALIAGSIAPDFEYFLKMETGSEHSHTLAGMVYFDLPVCFLLAFVFHQVIRKGLIENLPGFVQSRVQSLRCFNFLDNVKCHYWVFIYSALLGSATHLLWDSFTHGRGFMVKQFPVFASMRFPFGGVQYPLWYALQNISSVVGLSIILIFFFTMKKSNTEIVKPNMGYWLSIFLVTAIALLLRYCLGEPMKLGSFIVSLTAALLFALVIIGLVQTMISSRLPKYPKSFS